MAKLLKIIMINGHMPGVVELDLEGHTNICGSNASGKTTLQRMVPVFYGELPNKVVPRTRDNFDKYYLPYKNSYVIYTYDRPTQGPAHVVLTKRADGVDYRFVDAAYEPRWYLQQSKQGTVARDYSDWMSQLKQAGIETSHKISAVSEYRSIILNDIKLERSQRAERLKAKKLAAKFALAPDGFALRHIEKLVSAVHAKEGKMDTLKSMLAAILEEDGYERPENTFTRAKIQHWLQQMRQYMKVEQLQAQLQKLQQLNSERTHANEGLWHLKSVLEEDYAQLQTQQADLEAQLQEWKRKRDVAEDDYNRELRALLDAKQEASAELEAAESKLERAQASYDRYRDDDMEAWGRALEKLPQQRQELQELDEHYRLLLDKHKDAQSQLDAEKLKLQQRLDKVRTQLQAQKDAQQAELAQLNETFNDSLEAGRRALQQQQNALQQSFTPQLQDTREQLAQQKAASQNSGLNEAEQEATQLADARFEACMDALELAQGEVDQALKQLELRRKERLQSSEHVNQARRSEATANDTLETLRQRLKPAAGSLRQFLRDNVEHWQHSFGKVIAEPLLQRTDLLPQKSRAETETIFGVKLDLQALELPEHAATEERLLELLEQAEAELAQRLKERKDSEGQLHKANEAVAEAEQLEAKAQQKRKASKNDLDYARDHKARLQQEHKAVLQQRKQEAEQQVAKLQRHLTSLEQQLQQQLSELESDAKAAELERKAEHQETQQQFLDAMAECDQELQRKTAQTKEQMHDLEQAFNDKLAADGVDKRKLERTKTAMHALEEQIQRTEQQREPYRAYQAFMADEWKVQRPKWQQQEQQARQALREGENALAKLKTDYQRETEDLKARIKAAEARRAQQKELLAQLQAMVARMAALPVALQPEKLNRQAAGDVNERLVRAHDLFEQAQKVEKELQHQLTQFESELHKDVDSDFSRFIEKSLAELGESPEMGARVEALANLLSILEDRQEQTINKGITIGKGLVDVFTVFDDIHKRVNDFSRRLTQEVSDDLPLDAIQKAEVKISSTIDELGFWAPLKAMAKHYKQWRQSGELVPSQAYLDELAQVAELIRSDQDYSIESLLRLELHIQEKGQAMVIRNDRQLLESSSHGMAYLILVKFLLAFTRLLRPADAGVVLHWPVDEIGTLAYHNVEKLFAACDHNAIYIVGAFPNPESDVLLLFNHRYLIEPHHEQPNKGQLKRIKPRLSPLAEKLAQLSETEVEV